MYNSLNDDNFFIILNDWMILFKQPFLMVILLLNIKKWTTIPLRKQQRRDIQLFKDYYQGKDNWKKEIIWKKTE